MCVCVCVSGGGEGRGGAGLGTIYCNIQSLTGRADLMCVCRAGGVCAEQAGCVQGSGGHEEYLGRLARGA